jgi:hypothetical protein
LETHDGLKKASVSGCAAFAQTHGFFTDKTNKFGIVYFRWTTYTALATGKASPDIDIL